MIRAEFSVEGGGRIAMVVADDSPASFARVALLGESMHVPASVCMVPIPADVTDRHTAMFWYPKRTPPKEQHEQASVPPCLDDPDED